MQKNLIIHRDALLTRPQHIMLIPNTAREIKEILQELNARSKEIGLKISGDKTKVISWGVKKRRLKNTFICIYNYLKK